MNSDQANQMAINTLIDSRILDIDPKLKAELLRILKGHTVCIGDHAVMHIEGRVIKLHETYYEVETQNSIIWTVEYDDDDWVINP